jgi:hypothetical protein
MYMKSLALAAAISTAAAQNTTSFCDKYTIALFMNNTAENQLMLLTAVVNTAVIGNCKCIASRTSPCCQTDNIQTAKARLEKPSAVSSPREPTTASKSTFFHTSTVLFSQATAVDHQA